MPDLTIICSHRCGHNMARKVMRYSRSTNRGTGGFVVAQEEERLPVSEKARAFKNTQAYWKDKDCLDCHARFPAS